MFSWISIADVLEIVTYLQTHKDMAGVYNCSSPHPINNKTLMKTFREAMKMPFGLPSPKLLLEIGAVFIKTETELILKSRWVVPERLLAAGFTFEYPTIVKALNNILEK